MRLRARFFQGRYSIVSSRNRVVCIPQEMYCQQIDYVLFIVHNKNIPAYLGVHMNARGQGVILDLRNANCVGRVVFIIARFETLHWDLCSEPARITKSIKMAVVWQSL